MTKINPVENEEEEVNSGKSLSHASSSSLRFSTEDKGETEENCDGRRRGQTFEELATEVIREMCKAEREEGGKSGGTARLGEPPQIPTDKNNEEPQEDPIREILNLTGTDDEAEAEKDGSKRKMEETVNTLVTESAEQREQVTRMVDMMERIVSWMDRENQSSNNPSPATSVAPQMDLQQPNADLAGPSRKRKPTATTNQTPSGTKWTK